MTDREIRRNLSKNRHKKGDTLKAEYLAKAIKYLDDAPLPNDGRIFWDAEKGEFIEGKQ